MRTRTKLLLVAAILALFTPVLTAPDAWALYIGDGAQQNGTTGGWDITDYGICVSGIKADGTIMIDPAHNRSRPDCIDHVLGVDSATNPTIPTDPNYDTQAECIATSGRANGDDVSHYWVSNTCVDPNTGQGINLEGLDRTAANCALKGGVRVNACIGSWVYTGPAGDGAPGFCYTTINVTTAYGTAATCPTTTNGYAFASSKCTYSYGIAGYANANIVKKDGSGNYAAAGSFVDLSSLTQGQCLAAGASWSTGTRKSGTTSIATTTLASTAATVTGTRSGCLECHNSVSQNNSYAERWKEPYLKTGHKNMLRKVTPGMNWAGPDGAVYVSWGAGGVNTIDWGTGTTTIGSTIYPLLYIFGDWMAPPPDGLDVVVWNGTAKYNNGSAYSCAACHSTGWSNPSSGVCSLSSKTTQAACTTAGGTWYPSSGVQGTAYSPQQPGASWPAYANPDNTINGITGRWDRDGIMCSRCHQSVFAQTGTNAAGTPFTAPAGTSTHNVTPASTANEQVNNICFGCHQGIAKKANNTGADADLGNPAANIPVKNTGAGGAYVPEFNGHVLGNEFLNSPHARYSVPAGNGIVPNSLGKYDLVGNTVSQYNSAFKGYICRSSTSAGGGSILATVWKNGAITEIKGLEDCNLANGKAAGDTTSYGYWQTESQGACTTCHDVHQSLFDPAAQEPFKKECQTCHTDSTGDYSGVAPQVDLATISHPTGTGTPLDTGKYVNACEVCHMPKATDGGFPMHLWRINSDPNYGTFPSAADFNGNIKKNANPAVDAAGYTDAIWTDLDLVCGQCHGANGSAHLMSKSGIAPFAQTMHTGGNAYSTNCADCHVKTIAHQTGPNTPSSCSSCHGTTRPGVKPAISDACITCHASSGPAHTFTAAQLAPYAAVIHDGGAFPTCTGCHTGFKLKWVNHPDDPSRGTPSCADCHRKAGQIPTVAAACNHCHGGSDGPKAVKPGVPYLTAADLAKVAANIHRDSAPKASMQVIATDRKPDVAGKQVYVGDTVQVDDTSVAGTNSLTKIKVKWGDGTVSVIAPGGSATHAYSVTGSVTIKLVAIDSAGLTSSVSKQIAVKAPVL